VGHPPLRDIGFLAEPRGTHGLTLQGLGINFLVTPNSEFSKLQNNSTRFTVFDVSEPPDE
jgi:hypothetical protein